MSPQPIGMGIKDGRGYGPYGMGYVIDRSTGRERAYPIGPSGETLPLEYDFQPGPPPDLYLSLRRPQVWLPHLGTNPGPEAFGITPAPSSTFVSGARRNQRGEYGRVVVGEADQVADRVPLVSADGGSTGSAALYRGPWFFHTAPAYYVDNGPSSVWLFNDDGNGERHAALQTAPFGMQAIELGDRLPGLLRLGRLPTEYFYVLPAAVVPLQGTVIGALRPAPFHNGPPPFVMPASGPQAGGHH